jgi:hypothetical protein
MGKASSSKKVARAARAGGRSAGTRQRNLLFPASIGAIVIVGVGLVAFAAHDRKTDESVAPVANVDHWHAAYGIYVCDEFQPAIPEFDSPNGIHTHGDGVIHIHPFSDAAAGENATLGVFLEDAGIEVTEDSLTVGDQTWTEGEDQCDGKDAQVQVDQWTDVSDEESNAAVFDDDFGDTRFRADGEGYVIAFVSEDTDVPKPDTATNLAELGAIDGGAAATSIPGGDPAATTDTTAAADDAGADSTATTESDSATTVGDEGSVTTTGDATTETTGG